MTSHDIADTLGADYVGPGPHVRGPLDMLAAAHAHSEARTADRGREPLPTLAGLFRLVIDDGGVNEENCDAATFADAVAWAEVAARTSGRTVTLEHDMTDLVLACRRSDWRGLIVWEHNGTVTTPAGFAATILEQTDLVIADHAWSIVRPNGCVAVDFAPDEVTARGRADASHDRYHPTEPPYRVEPTLIG